MVGRLEDIHCAHCPRVKQKDWANKFKPEKKQLDEVETLGRQCKIAKDRAFLKSPAFHCFGCFDREGLIWIFIHNYCTLSNKPRNFSYATPPRLKVVLLDVGPFH